MDRLENTIKYHEVDFLLPSQRFNINFSYVSQRGLPFVREFVLRLVHLSPMTKSQISVFFGFSRREIDEAIADLVTRDELLLNETGRLALTEKSMGYFSDLGEAPRLALLQDSGARLSFDLATFTCVGNIRQDKWKSGISLKVDAENVANSESLVEKQFQYQFHDILNRELLSKSLIQDEKDHPTIYTVNTVNKIGQTPLRLKVNFIADEQGGSVEREDFEMLNDSDYVQRLITIELDRLARPNNTVEIARAMIEIKDDFTIKLIDAKTNSINLKYLEDLNKLEENSGERVTFIGPLYSQKNWELLQKNLAPVLVSRIENKNSDDKRTFIWIAPSDPYWCKCDRLHVSLSDFYNKSKTKDKTLYVPRLYLPIENADDHRAIKQWKNELEPYLENAHGIIEGFLGGNVEVMLFEEELAVVVYHLSLPDTYPVTMPIGFICKDAKTVNQIRSVVRNYLEGSSGHEKPNDCGQIINKHL